MILPNRVLRSKRWQTASPGARWAWYEAQRLVQTVLGRLPDLQELAAAGITPTAELFDLRGDRWEPVGVPWLEIHRAFKVQGNLPMHAQKAHACAKSPSMHKFATNEKTAQLSEPQEEVRESGQHLDSAETGATEATADCSPPLDPPIYNIYNKKEEFIGGGEGGGGAKVWLADYVFQTRDKGARVLSQEEMQQLVQAHGIAAVKRELPRASMWLGANPRRRKASSGLLLFLSGWIRRTVPPEGEKQLPAKSWSAGRGEAQKSWRVGM